MSPSTGASSPARQARLAAAPVDTTDIVWKPLYRVGGAAAVTLLALIVLAIIVVFLNPPPTTVIDDFTLFQKNAFLGLLALDLPYLVSQALIGLLVLTLCVALRHVSPSSIVLVLASELVGLAVYFTSNPAFGMLNLSNQYAAATTDAQRSQIEAAGRALVANYTGTAYDVSYVLSGVALLLIAIVMLRSTLFSKGTAWVGCVMGALSLVPASAGTVGLFFAFGALVPMVPWLILVARRLLQLGQRVSLTAAPPSAG